MHDRRPGRRGQRRQLVLQHQPAAVEHADPGAQLLDLGQQVAGQEDRRPAAVQLEQQLADLVDALRVQAVGRLVEHQQLGTAQQRAGQPEPLPHAQRVRLHRPAADAGQPDLLQHLVDPRAPGAPRRRPGPDGVEQREVLPPGQVPVGAGPSISAPTRGSTRRPARGIGSPSSSISPLVGSTSPSSIRTVVVLPGAVGAEEAVDVAGPHVEVDAVDGAQPPVPLGQPAGAMTASRRPLPSGQRGGRARRARRG